MERFEVSRRVIKEAPGGMGAPYAFAGICSEADVLGLGTGSLDQATLVNCTRQKLYSFIQIHFQS